MAGVLTGEAFALGTRRPWEGQPPQEQGPEGQSTENAENKKSLSRDTLSAQMPPVGPTKLHCLPILVTC